MLLDSGWEAKRELKLLCGGEALSSELAEHLLERCSELWNLYGPTETTIWSTLSRVEAGAAPITIGHPIANTEVYVLDAYLQPVPVGIPGELHIGGEGLARGYLHRSELTAEKFITCSFDGAPPVRIYRTGDRARFLEDGTLEFLGRRDHQVKIRGHRVELGEIESALTSLPQVRQAAVTSREIAPGEQQLVAYFVPAPGTAPASAENFRKALETKLPDYAIPSDFVVLEVLPLTPSGKIDREALPRPNEALANRQEHAIAPRNEIEEGLAKIWREVLGLTQVGVHDNFFELGGHSLRLTQVISRIRQIFRVELPFAQAFQEPTIEAIATHIQEFLGKYPITPSPQKTIIKRRTARR
jgi:acyl-coenzyme A synthetase/AMP-(fatty) acid ligase/acyl carrier protein